VKTRTRIAAALVVLAFAVGAFLAVSGRSTSDDPSIASTNVAERPDPRVVARPRASRPTEKPIDSHSIDAALSTTDDPSKWPIRVTTNVPGARVTMQVRLYGGDPDPAPETKTCDAQGFVGFAAPGKDVPVHQFEFVARAEGRTPAYASCSEPGEVNMMLHPAVAIRGFVRDDAGHGIGGAHVSFPDSTFTVNERPTETDGSFEVFVEEAGTVHVQAFRLGFEFDAGALIEAPATGVVIVLHRGLEVSGRVSFPSGLPVPGVGVSIPAERIVTTTDADGRFALSGLVRGPVGVKCGVTEETRTVDAGANTVDFVVKRSIARIRFLDAQGRPFRSPGMSIRVVKGDVDLAMSAGEGPPDGVEMMDGPPGAQVLVSASSADGRTGSGSTTFDETPRLHEIDVVLGAARPTGTIRLVVREESAEIPKSIHVTVDDDVWTTIDGGAHKRLDLDAAGAVEIPSVPAGAVHLTVAAAARWSSEALDTYLVAAKSDATIEVGRTTEVVARLLVGGRVRAVVRDEDGVPVAPRLVRLSLATDAGRNEMFVHRKSDGGWSSELDASPSVMIDAVPPGRYVVHAWTEDGRDAQKEVDVVRGETADVELVVKAAAK